MNCEKAKSIATNRWRAQRWPLLLVASAIATAAHASTPQEAFHAENGAAMDKMMAAMEIKPSGDIDRDFAAMMIPHHQGAIDMALAELRYGSNEQLRRIAQEIIVEQQQEIAAMQFALGEQLPPSVPSPTQVSAPAHQAIDAPEHNEHSH
ncbi:DUF305 domain-containing protein [Paraburkholderia diazotrophica]|uniref:DUF305 domain-containing protein n=1 Tax=Paraburkholderia diazotrophica TaxID=667676 RepID=UPI00316BE17D